MGAEIHIPGIPRALSDIPQWVLWNNEPHPSKPRGNKVPKYNSCGTIANGSSTDHLTWNTLDSVCSDHHAFKTTGIGFVLTKPTGIFCVDIDECVCEDTISGFGTSILDIFSDKTYAELSYHEDGLHIFGLGSLPDGERGGGRGGIEVYDSGRFIAITGRKLKTSNPDITQCQKELDLVVKKFPKRKKSEKPLVATAPSNMERIQDKYGLSCVSIGYPSDAMVSGHKVVGSHPVHGSKTGNNFHIDTYHNTWYCFRCESGGGALELYAVVKGIIDCEDAQPGCLKNLWGDIFEALESDGYKPDPKKFPKTIFDKRNDVKQKLISLGVL